MHVSLRDFVSVYTLKFSTEAPALMKYGDIVQDLVVRNHNWKFYDENFRSLRQGQPQLYPRGTIHWELLLRAQVNEGKKTQQLSQVNSVRGNRPGPIPKDFGYRFNRAKDCSGCEFKHQCFKCDGGRRAVQFWFLTSTR